MRKRIKILLVNLPWQKEGKWGVRAGSRWPHIKDAVEENYLPFPFFLAYATALLQKEGIETRIIDAIAEEIEEKEFLEKVSRINFDYLVAETSIPSFYYDINLLKKISALGIRIILCGPNIQICQEDFLSKNRFIDFVLCGEYEFTLLELVRCLQEGRIMSGVKGLIYREGEKIINTDRRPPFDINLLPWPERDNLPMEKYLDAPGAMLTPSVQMVASRGCPFRCQFCLWPQVIYFGRHYRTRNIKDTVDEMEFLLREKGFKSVYFDDDTFNIGKERMLAFCREVIKRGLNKFQWAIMARADLMDEEILENMKKAGLWAVKYGIESANQRLLDNIQKDMNLKKAIRIVRLTNRLGIRTHLAFTFGLPGETERTIKDTIELAQKLNPFSVQFSIMTPFPGTKYYEVLKQRGVDISDDLNLYDGNHVCFKSEGLSSSQLTTYKKIAYSKWRSSRDLKDNLKNKSKDLWFLLSQRKFLDIILRARSKFKAALELFLGRYD